MSINLLAWRENKSQRMYRQFILLSAIIIISEIIGVFFWRQWLLLLTRQNQQEISTLADELTMKNKTFAQMHGSVQQLKSLTQLQSQLNHLTIERQQLLAVLSDLPSFIPASSRIIRLDYHRQLRIVVETKNGQDSQQLLRKLPAQFAAKLVANTQKANGVYQFELQLILTKSPNGGK